MEWKEGYIEDFVSHTLVRATPEEMEAVQVFSRMLVSDYGYPKDCIQTRPQWKVWVRPSDTKKEYPVDIAVFSEQNHQDENIQIIVECKRASRKDGRTQLEDYLRFSTAELGVWFNGSQKLFLQKTESTGRVLFAEIPNIPKYGERLEDLGLYQRKALRPAHNLKSVFCTVRNYLAANAVGITRDEAFAAQMIDLIFCKIYDERFTRPEDTVTFRAGIGEKPAEVKKRIGRIFTCVKAKYADVIDQKDEILLDEHTLTYAVGELQLFCLMDSERDAIADAFETFIGPSLKGGQGQFFTPRNVVKLLVAIVQPQIDDTIIDPACGSGGFLVEALRDVWQRIEERGAAYGWPAAEIISEKQKAATDHFRGIDKDHFLSKVAKAYMTIIGNGRSGVFCENSLHAPASWKTRTQEHIVLGCFDVVMTNPPFGKKLKIDDQAILRSYHLGHKWTLCKSSGDFIEQNRLYKGQAPQILFVERCLELLKDEGRLGIIVPESMFCNPSHRYIIQYLKSVARIKAVISLPEELFQPYTHAKTCAVVIEKIPTDSKQGHEIFMAIAKWCGHDSRGLAIPRDDLLRIVDRYLAYKEKGSLVSDAHNAHNLYKHWGFVINESQIANQIYLPKYYNPEIAEKLNSLEQTHELPKFGKLVEQGIISLSSGHEVGKLAYGSGNIPFIRTSEIANWELKLDPKHGLSEAIYEALKDKQDVQEHDILMVCDGTYLIGACALVPKYDTKIVYQSHIYKIRSNNHQLLHPFLLLAVLSSPVVQEQIFAKRFTQDIIDTLGARIHELVLPIPKSVAAKEKIIKNVNTAMEHKETVRQLMRKTIQEVAPVAKNRDFKIL